MPTGKDTPIHRVQAGQFQVHRDGLITTVLGSCIAACAHCPVTRIGGINHFMLPDSGSARTNCPLWQSEEGRYGVHAMELLINEMIKRGAMRDRLEFKVVGGARMMTGVSDVGQRNLEFVREFLSREGFTIDREIAGGTHGRVIRYEPATGRLWVRQLADTRAERRIVEEELDQRRRRSVAAVAATGSVDLF